MTEPNAGAVTRVPLTRERILATAIIQADAGGIDSLSMRRLGQSLGVEAMSLYNHVANKDDILNGILELVMEEIALPAPGANWKAGIRASAMSAHEVLLRHSWACDLMMSPSGVSMARLRWMDSVLGTLRQSGFSVDLTHHAYHALDSHIVGFTLWLANLPARGDDLREMAGTFLQEHPIADMPHLIEHIQYHLDEPLHHDEHDEGEFAFGLDLILDGIERLRDAGR